MSQDRNRAAVLFAGVLIVSALTDAALQSYFKSRMKVIEGWFNIIAPAGKRLAVLKDELDTLKAKNWQEIHA